MLGDSIVNDTSRSCWNLLLEKKHPSCRIEKVTSVRGSTGCWWYKEGDVAFTRKGKAVYAIYLARGEGEGPPERVTLRSLKPAPGSEVWMLGAREALRWEATPQGEAAIEIPASIRQAPPCRHAFAFTWRLPEQAR